LLVTLPVAGITASADVVEGAKVYQERCVRCHALDNREKSGPTLRGVFNSPAGTVAGFEDYKGLHDADWSWDEANLHNWLANPKLFIKSKGRKKTSMRVKLKSEADRSAVISFLKTL